MENEAGRRDQVLRKTGEHRQTFGGDGLTSLHGMHMETLRNEMRRAVRALVERFGLSREDLLAVYDECVRERGGEHAYVDGSGRVQCTAMQVSDDSGECAGVGVQINGASEFAGGMDVQEGGEEEGEGGGGEAVRDEREGRGEGGRNGREENGQGEEKEVDKMQTLVQSALRVYEASSSTAVEIGQKRRSFTLEDELNLQPSPFAQELLDRDQTVVAQAIKKYMNQYSVPQREVVEKTGLNQSHLSQHFLHGVTMKRSKRVKLYHWFEDDQKVRTGKLSTAVGALNSVLESPKVEGSRRRPRWKWSPISTQILTEAFKKNHFPTREQRVELARVCNEAELAMNNGSPIRGPEGDTEGITEQRVNTWFTNRRKGLSTPSPTRGLAVTPNHSATIYGHSLPPLLRAATPTTPTQSYSQTLDPDHRSEDKCFSPAPATVQTLVNHIQQAQVASQAGTSSAMQLAATPAATPQAVPLAAIAIPGAASNTVLASASSLAGSSLPTISQSSTTPLAPPIQAFAINSDGIPTAIIPHTQLQAILSQVQVSSDASLPGQLQLANASGGVITIPMLHTAQKVAASTSTPSQLHSITSPPMKSSLPHTVPLPQLSTSSTTTAFTTLSPLTSSQAPLPTIIGSNQVQALLSQLQQQAKLQGTPQVQFNPTSTLPLTITLPGASNEDILKAQALLINQVQSSSEP